MHTRRIERIGLSFASVTEQFPFLDLVTGGAAMRPRPVLLLLPCAPQMKHEFVHVLMHHIYTIFFQAFLSLATSQFLPCCTFTFRLRLGEEAPLFVNVRTTPSSSSSTSRQACACGNTEEEVFIFSKRKGFPRPPTPFVPISAWATVGKKVCTQTGQSLSRKCSPFNFAGEIKM